MLASPTRSMPSTWSESTIGECCDVLDSMRIPVNAAERHEREGDIPYYGANGQVGWIDDYIFDEDLVLVAEDGGFFSEYATRPIAYRVSGKSWVNNHAHVLRARSNSTNSWIFYNLVHRDVQPFINGTTRSKLNQAELRDIPIWLPPLHEQRRIAEILDTVDEAIQQTEAVIAKLKQIKTGLLHDLLTRGIDEHGQLRDPIAHPEQFKDSPLGRIPQEWSVSHLSDFLLERPKNGYSPKEADEWTGIQMLGLGCLTQQGFQPNQLKRAPKNDPSIVRALLQNGDLLVSRSNTRELVALAGVYSDVGTPCLYPDLMMRLRPNERTNNQYLFHALMSGPVRRQLTGAAQGTSGSMVKVNSTTVMNTIVAIPSRSEQQRILESLAQIEARLRSEAALQDKCRLMRAGLMSDLLAGRVRTGAVGAAAV